MPGRSMEWIEEDLLRIIAEGEQESISLDYKACDSLQNTEGKKGEISKDVSAFANSAGGVIVYGMKEVDHVAADLDEGFNPASITKEWLEDVIQGPIRPRIQNLHINPVQMATRAPGRVAYVVTIPQSNTAHQAHDKRYYKRFNFKSEPMEDHEIRDVMNRLKFPLLAPTVSAKFIDRKQQIIEYRLDVQISNKGPIAAHNWKLVLFIPMSLCHSVKGYERQELVEIASRKYGHQWFKQSYKGTEILFPEDETKISRTEFIYKLDTSRFDRNENEEPFLLWKICADSMPPQDGTVLFSSLPHPVV